MAVRLLSGPGLTGSPEEGDPALQYVEMVVLDDADEMLDMGFIEDIEDILKQIPTEKRQVMLFSATMPLPIRKLARNYMKNPKTISVSQDELTVTLTEQVFYETREKIKVEPSAGFVGGDWPR